MVAPSKGSGAQALGRSWESKAGDPPYNDHDPYGDFLLTQRHVDRLAGFGVSLALAVGYGFVSVLEGHEPALLSVGFPERQVGGLSLPGLLIPVWALRVTEVR
jgi:hypothetical protein